MAMVTARRGAHSVRVSKSSFEKLFKNKGYIIIAEDKKKDIPKESATEDVADDVEVEAEEIAETEDEVETIPISEMNKEQLMEYAKEHNIDTSSARNVREARQIIQKAIRDSKM